MVRIRSLRAFVLGSIVAALGCAEQGPKKPSKAATQSPEPGETKRTSKLPEPPKLAMPVPFWKGGKVVHEIDAALAGVHGHLVLDLGEVWTPYLFTDGVTPDGKEAPNAYRSVYLALAREEFPDDHHGERARDDKYLELYGIQPTLSVLRERFRETAKLACAAELDLQPLIDFQGLITYQTNNTARRKAEELTYLNGQVRRMMHEQKVETPELLDPEKLGAQDRGRLQRYLLAAPDYAALVATQERLRCEGQLSKKVKVVRGALDWVTHEALAEFEHRHRVYSWGYLGKDTMEYLRMRPIEAERAGVLRVLTERAVHAAGVIEDGSTSTLYDGTPRTFEGSDGERHPIPDLVGDLQARIVAAFGLQTPESTLAWLESLAELAPGEHRYVAIEAPELPEYYDGDMLLTLEYDRGDVWYDFPYDESGAERKQPVEKRPRVTLFTSYNKQRIALARFGTTIGGWRSELVGETVMWRYKDSPIGERVWKTIAAAPVWLPPDSTPARDLLKRRKNRKHDEPEYELNLHEMGPSYASAYGLVAAYHRTFQRRADGSVGIGNDEGIRTHGSVDYMSIMRRHSHGCHRLHNHIAVRLMSFLLAHRPHARKGMQPLSFKKEYEYEEETYPLDIKQGGYIFELEAAVFVNVLEGRIRGDLQEPIEFAVPKYDPDAGAYVMPDGGGAVQVQGSELIEVPLPVRPDAGPGLGSLQGLLDPYGDPVETAPVRHRPEG